MTDEALIKRVERGDQTAFWLLYERHHGVVFRFLYRLAGSVEAAEDLTHDTFVVLMKNPQNYDASQASLRTYLCAVARNLSRAHRRRRAAEEHLTVPNRHLSAASTPDPLASLLDDELVAQVRSAVKALRPLLREVLVLVEYEGFSLAETATIVGASVGTVKARLHRARRAVRDALARYVDAAQSPLPQRNQQ